MKLLRCLSAFTLSTIFALHLAHPESAQAQKALGIDVSDYQGTANGSINWTSVKNSGRTFAWTKATEGASGQYLHQTSFSINENNGKAAGVIMGAYHFAHPGQNAPASEASYFWSTAGAYIQSDGLTLMPMLDMEVFTGVTGAASYSDWVNNWCVDIVADAANAGVNVRPCIYFSACKGNNFDSSISQWYNDVANYGITDGAADPQNGTAWSACPSYDPWGSSIWHVWQYASAPADGSVPGVSGNCDVDVFNGDYSAMTNKLLATVSGSGTIYYWDQEGTTGGNPYTGSMNGTWENNKWSGSSGGQASPIAWVDVKAACFGAKTGIGTPAYTVTMNSNHIVAGFFDGALTPKACDVTITGPGTINLATGPQALDSANPTDGSLSYLRLNTVIAGDGQLVPEGTGQSFLNAANLYTGGTALGYSTVPFSGTVNFNNDSAFGSGPITFQSVGTGGTLTATGAAAINLPNNVVVASTTTNNINGNAAGVTFGGSWAMNAAASIGSGGAANSLVVIGGAMTGTAALTKYNPGILSINGAGSYNGAITISAGTLAIGGAGQLGSGTFTKTIANAGALNYSSSATQTMSGVISGAGTLNQTSGALTLSAINTYSGYTTVTGGTLKLGVNNAVPSGSSLQVANGAVFDMNGKSESLATLGGPLGETLPAGNVINNNATLTINGATVASTGQSGSGAYSGVISGAGSVVVSGGGSTTFSGSNIYGGSTTVTAGTLVPSFNGALPPNSAVTVNTPGIFELASVNETVPSLSGSGFVNLESGTLTVGGSATTTFSGVIRNSPATYNNGAFVSGLQGFYYPTATFTGTPTIRTDATVNFSDLTSAAQNPISPTTNQFTVRWIGQVLTTSSAGAYTFTTTSDDGTRCWVNGVLVVDNWAFQGATPRSGTITLAANTKYDLRVEYVQGTGGASCVLSWTPPGGSSAVIPTSNLSTYAGVGGLTRTGAGRLTLSGANTYAGPTTIIGGTLALGASGSINNSSAINLGAGGTLDVSAIATYAANAGTALTASGSVSPATIAGGTTVNFASQPITLNYDGSHPALTIQSGALALNGNAFTINGPLLAGGVYTLIHQVSGNISSAGTYNVNGSAIPTDGAAISLTAINGDLVLTITYPTTITLSPLTQSYYGQPVTLTATVAPSPMAGTVQFYDNGLALGGLIPVTGGAASYTTNDLAIGDHPITAAYNGATGYLASATTNSIDQQVVLGPNSAPVTINHAARMPDGTVQLNFTGIPGYTYLIQGTLDMTPPINWTTLGTNTADANGQFQFTDTGATNYPAQYYRTALSQ